MSQLGNWNLAKELKMPYMLKLSESITELRSNVVIYPQKNDVFKAFRLTDYEDVRVVIIGQDPYFNGNADGLAFSCKTNTSPSLHNIFKAVEKDFGACSYNNDLSRWASQGVLLLNTILTVEHNKPLSHKNLGWEKFMEKVMIELNMKHKLVWLLFGSEAHKYAKFKAQNHLVIKTEHPAAASYNNTFWRNNNCFKLTNDYLEDPVRWV